MNINPNGEIDIDRLIISPTLSRKELLKASNIHKIELIAENNSWRTYQLFPRGINDCSFLIQFREERLHSVLLYQERKNFGSKLLQINERIKMILKKQKSKWETIEYNLDKRIGFPLVTFRSHSSERVFVS